MFCTITTKITVQVKTWNGKKINNRFNVLVPFCLNLLNCEKILKFTLLLK